MFARIGTFCYKAIQSKWINIVCLSIIGIFLIRKGYAFLEDDPGHRSGVLHVISGSIFLLCGVLEGLLHYLSVVGKAVSSVIAAILVISAAALFFVA